MEMNVELENGAKDNMKDRNNDNCDNESNSVDSCDGGSGSENGEPFGLNLPKAHKLLADVICACDVTIPGMLDFSNQLNPDVNLDSDTVKTKCLRIYEEEKVKVKNFFKNMNGQISLSVDVLNHYKRDGSYDEFMCLSAHFIDDNWKPRKWVIRFQRLSDWDDDFISDAILKTLKDLEIEDKVSTYTSSSLVDDDEVDEWTEIVKTQIQTVKSLQLNGQLFRVNCCAGMFNQMTNDAFKEISDTIDKVRLLIPWKSPPLWYLTTHKLKIALEQESMGEFSPDNVDDFYDIPSSDEWKKVEAVCKLTERIHSIAKVLFETKYPTVNLYLSNLQELREYLIIESKSSCDLTCNVAKKMLIRLDKYQKSVFLLLGIASFLDPRYKMKYIEYLSSKCEGSDGSLEVALISDAIHKLYDDYATNGPEDEVPMDVSDSSSLEDEDEEEEQEVKKVEDQGSRIPSWVQDYNQFAKIDKPPRSDLEWYVEEPVITWSQDFDVLKWWKAKSPKYPTLAKMARDIFGIPMSVATSAGAYCTEPREARLDRLGAGRDLQNALMCTRTWLFKKGAGNNAAYRIPVLCGPFCF